MYTIGFSGKMGSGKDYTAELVLNKIKELKPNAKVGMLTYAEALRNELDLIILRIKQGVNIGSLADEFNVSLSEMGSLASLFCSDEEFFNDEYSTFKRTPKAREILQYWGTDVRRRQDNNYWVNQTKLAARNRNLDYLFITDVRFPNEADGVKSLNGIVVECSVNDEERLRRLQARGLKMTKSSLQHSSETSMDNYEEFDLKVDTGTSNADSDVIEYLTMRGCL